MKARKVAPAAAARWRTQLDLFGEVPITRQDVYAWLLAVVDLDPTSFRAFDYVRTYGVLNKITRAKLDGTFEQLVATAKNSARFRELTDRRAVEHAKNHLGLGEPAPTRHEPLRYVQLRAPNRAPDVIRGERERLAREKKARRAVKATMLQRLPTAMPSLSQMLGDIGNPSAEAMAGALDVSESTARRWLREDAAPRPVLLSLFWLTRWGVSTIDAQAQNDAQSATLLARSLRGEVEELRAGLGKVGKIADFGSANDPTPNLPASIATPGYAIPEALAHSLESSGAPERRPAAGPQGLGAGVSGAQRPDIGRDVPLVFTSIEEAPLRARAPMRPREVPIIFNSLRRA